MRISDWSSDVCSSDLTSAGIESVLRDRQIEFDKREEIALREISFGLFDGYADDELQEHFPLEHSWYQKHLAVEKSDGADGEFWAAMPMGESRAQVADRVKGVFGTIQIGRASCRERVWQYV